MKTCIGCRLYFTLLPLFCVFGVVGCGPSAEDQARLDQLNQRNRQGPEAQYHRAKQSFDLAIQEFQEAHSVGDDANSKAALNRILARRDTAIEQCLAVIDGERSMNPFSPPGETSPEEREEDLMLATGILKVLGAEANSAVPALEQLQADESQADRVRNGAAAALAAVNGE